VELNVFFPQLSQEHSEILSFEVTEISKSAEQSFVRNRASPCPSSAWSLLRFDPNAANATNKRRINVSIRHATTKIRKTTKTGSIP
jgi:hypothetical protein